MSLTSGIENFYALEGKITISIGNFVVSVCQKKFVGEPFGVSETFRYRKVLCFRGLCHDFLSKVFCHTVAKNFVEEPFCAVFQKNSGSQKVYG